MLCRAILPHLYNQCLILGGGGTDLVTCMPHSQLLPIDILIAVHAKFQSVCSLVLRPHRDPHSFVDWERGQSVWYNNWINAMPVVNSQAPNPLNF